MLRISPLLVRVHYFRYASSDLSEISNQVVHRDPVAAADVHRVPVGSTRLKQPPVHPDNVVDVGEVAGLLAVPENRDQLVCEHLFGEDGDREVRAHPGAIDREVAKGDGRKAVDFVEDPAVVLGGELRYPIGGDRHGGVRFVKRQVLHLPVD